MERRLPMIACVMLLGLGCDGPQPPAGEAPAVEPAALDKPAEAAEVPEGAAAGCTYDYDPGATKLTWTAFKLTERVGVSGTFKGVTVTGTAAAPDPAKVFEHMRFEIDTSTVDSGEPERDPKIVAAFFGTLNEGAKITGGVTSLQQGKGTLELTLGGVTKPLELAYEVSDAGVLTATGKLDLTGHDGAAAVAKLSEVCKAKHTGEDGVTKLWPDVELKVESTLQKTCN